MSNTINPNAGANAVLSAGVGARPEAPPPSGTRIGPLADDIRAAVLSGGTDALETVRMPALKDLNVEVVAGRRGARASSPLEQKVGAFMDGVAGLGLGEVAARIAGLRSERPE